MRHVQDHQTKSNSCGQGEATKPDARQFIWQWSEHEWSAQPASHGHFIGLALWSSISCRGHNYHLADHGALFSPVLLGSSTSLPLAKVSPRQWPLQEAGRACPKEAQGYWGTFPTSSTTLVFTHFITLDFLLYFWQFCYHFSFNFQGIILFFLFFPMPVPPILCFLFFFSTQSYLLCSWNCTFPQFLLPLYLWTAFILDSAISLAVGQCTKPYQRFRFPSRGRLSRAFTLLWEQW